MTPMQTPQISYLNIDSLRPGLIDLLADLFFSILLISKRVSHAFDL